MSATLYLFDIDCTLLLTGGVGREATRLAMTDVFGTAGALDAHSFGGKTDWQTLVELLRDDGYDEAAVGAHMPAYEAAMAAHMARIIERYPVRACAGALELVAHLRGRDDALLGLVTGNVQTTAPIKLRAAGYDPDWFPVGAYGSEAHSRDDLTPLAHRRAEAHWARRIPPEAVVVIGDTPADVACARAIGACAVAVRTGYCAPGELEASQPDYLLDDLTAFLDVMADWR